MFTFFEDDDDDAIVVSDDEIVSMSDLSVDEDDNNENKDDCIEARSRQSPPGNENNAIQYNPLDTDDNPEFLP